MIKTRENMTKERWGNVETSGEKMMSECSVSDADCKKNDARGETKLLNGLEAWQEVEGVTRRRCDKEEVGWPVRCPNRKWVRFLSGKDEMRALRKERSPTKGSRFLRDQGARRNVALSLGFPLRGRCDSERFATDMGVLSLTVLGIQWVG